VKTLGIATIAGFLAFVAMLARADDGAANPPPSPSGAQDGGATGAEGGYGDRPKPRSMPSTKDKQRAVEATTRAASPSGGEALGDRGGLKPAKSWDEMTLAEQDAARRQWLLNSGDFGRPGVRAADRNKRSEAPGKGGQQNSPDKTK